MAEQHYLGFQRFAGRGLRYVVEYERVWLALIGWQSGAFKCRPRDRWIGWRPREQFSRLRLIANNTRLLVLVPPGTLPNLATCVMAANLRRLSRDWLEAYGHPLELAEAFVDPKHCLGTLRPPQEDVRLSAAARGPKTAALSRALPLLGAGAPGADAPRSPRLALVARRVRLDPGPSPRSGPQVPVVDPAGNLGVDAFVRVPRRRRHLALCALPEPGGVAPARRLAPQRDRSLPSPVASDPASGPVRHRPGGLSGGREPLGGAAAAVENRAVDGRQTSARCQPPRGGAGCRCPGYGDRLPGQPRRRHTHRQPGLYRGGR